jgi:hypothetical protein
MASKRAGKLGEFLATTPARKRESWLVRRPELREVIVEYVVAVDGNSTQVSCEQLAAWIRREMGIDVSPSAVRNYVREVRRATQKS